MTEVKRLNVDSDKMGIEHQNNEFAELFSASLKEQERPERDKILEGTVVRVDPDTVLVDVGRKSEGFVAITELRDAEGNVSVSVGDKVKVVSSRDGGNKFSKKRADQMAAWETIHEAGGEGAVLEGTIIAKSNGGFTVAIGGINAFLPESQVDIRPSGNSDDYIGLSGRFKVISLNQKRRNIVLSRLSLLEEDRKPRKSNEVAQDVMQVMETVEPMPACSKFKPKELLKHIYNAPEHLPLNRSHREFEAISPESLQGLESQSSLDKTAHLDSVFEVEFFSEDIREIIELFENDEYETARKKIRATEKTTETEKGLLLLLMLKLYADSSLWVTSPEEKFRTRIEQTYTDIHNEVFKQLDKELAEQFQQNAVSLIRQM